MKKQLRISILERDGDKCVICKDCSRLHIHHFDKNNKNNSLENLYTLCVRCHCFVHGRASNCWWI